MLTHRKKFLCIILVLIMLWTLIPIQNIHAEELDNYPYTIFAGSQSDGAIYFNAGNACVNGTICTNGTIVSENAMNVNGDKIECVSIDMPNLWDWINKIELTDKSMITDENLVLDEEIKLDDKDIIATRHGNIVINSNNVDLNGLIYAPEGNITIAAQNLNMNSVILIADKVSIQAPNVNINYNYNMAEKIEWRNQISNVQHKVHFDLLGVSDAVIEDQLVTDGECLQEPEDPEYDGYIFCGWYSDKEYKEWFDFSTNLITEDITLYAMWYNLTDETDTDGDGVEDEYEKLMGTNPLSSDTDGDGLSDYIELFYDLDTDPCKADTDENGTLDGDEDADMDGLLNLREIEIGTMCDCNDTDGDGLSDGEEINVYHTNPLSVDTDNDNLNDWKEILYGTDPIQYNDTFDITACVNKADMEDADINVSVKIDHITGEQADSLSIEPNTSESLFPTEMPGYMGCAYDFSMSGNFEKAKITFDLDQPMNENVDPIIYYFDEENQDLIPLDTVIENNCASAIITHFSTYILIDRITYENALQWLDPWDVTKYTDAEIVLLTDDSVSMWQNDHNDMRLTVARSLIDDMPENCKASIVKFSSSCERLCPMTADRKSLKFYLSRNYFNSSGLTQMNTALLSSLDYFTDTTNDATLKMIVLLSDGAATDGDHTLEIIRKARQKGIKIYSVGLGTAYYTYFNSYLRPLAENTGGAFYYANNASKLKDIYADITTKIDLTTDSDQDGLTDFYEDNLPAFNGIKLNLDKNHSDTDGDGLCDGEEITEVKYVYNKNRTKVRIYGKMRSNPTKSDSDGDGLLDNSAIYDRSVKIAPCDPKPLKTNGQNNIWKIHIKQMKKGRIGSTYKTEKLDTIINNANNLVKKYVPRKAKYVKKQLDYWNRKMIIYKKDDLDKVLLKYEKEVRKTVKCVKKKANGQVAAAIGAAFLNFSYDNYKDAYHSVPTTWQKKYGYNKLYDDVFRVTSNMNKSMNTFTYNGKNYALWLWKGDYWNLGTGAEIGLYMQSKESASHYDGVDFVLPMELSLYQYKKGIRLDNHYNWRPNANQWWITGFDWRESKPNPNRLVSVGKIDFATKKNMGKALYDKIKINFTDAIFDKDGTLWIIWRY